MVDSKSLSKKHNRPECQRSEPGVPDSTGSGTVQRCDNVITICIARLGTVGIFEPFILEHIERLPARTIAICGRDELLRIKSSDHSLLPKSLKPIGWPSKRFPSVSDERFDRACLKQFLQRNQVHAVLAEYGTTAVEVMDACAEARVPLVAHFLGFDAYTYNLLEQLASRYQQFFSRAAAIIAVSHAMEQQLISLGAPREKIHYNPCGADTSLFTGADPPNASPRFVAVGRFVEKKAPYLTLMAFKRVLNEVSDASLVMIGDGPLLESCRQMAGLLRIADRVKFEGMCNQTEIVAIFRTARAFVQHSIQASTGDSEGTPVAIIEAGSAGLPVVATAHAGIPDIVIHDKTGYLVPERDIAAMSKYMVRLGQNPGLAGRMGKAGAQRISSHFSLDISIDNLYRIINRAVRDFSGH